MCRPSVREVLTAWQVRSVCPHPCLSAEIYFFYYEHKAQGPCVAMNGPWIWWQSWRYHFSACPVCQQRSWKYYFSHLLGRHWGLETLINLPKVMEVVRGDLDWNPVASDSQTDDSFYSCDIVSRRNQKDWFWSLLCSFLAEYFLALALSWFFCQMEGLC